MSFDELIRLDLALSNFYGKGRASDPGTTTPIQEAVRRLSFNNRCFHAKAEDIEDINQEAWLFICEKRDGFKYQGCLKWLSYVKQKIVWLWKDWWRARQLLGIRDDQGVDGIVEVILTFGPDVINLAAGDVWFRYNHVLSLKQRNHQVLVAQLARLDGLSWEEASPMIVPAIDRETFYRWQNDPATLLDLVYRELYHTGPRLVAGLFGMEEEPDLGELFMTAQERNPRAPGIGPWTWGEAIAIIWRYGFGYPRQHIAQRLEGQFSEEDLDALFERCDAQLPLSKCMQNLRTLLGSDADELLLDRGIWERLAFEYRYRDVLEVEDVFERTSPQASIAGFHLTMKALNMWLSGKRLIRKLAKRLREMGIDDE